MDTKDLISLARRWEELERTEVAWGKPEGKEDEIAEWRTLEDQINEAGFEPTIDEWNTLVLRVKE